MNAKRMVENMFMGSSDSMVPVRVKELVFILGKSAHLSRLGVFFLGIQQG